MTRMELLAARANDAVEAALIKGVCLGEAECLIVREAVLVELVRVEREVWGKLVDKIESEMEKENESIDDQIWEIRDWLVARRQELGS